MNYKSIIVWGDSILKGIVSSDDLTQIRPIENNALFLTSQKLNIEVINKSIYGAPITKIRQTQLKNLAKGLKADICLIESGTNDCDYEWSQVSDNPSINHKPKVDLAEFIQILDTCVKTARENQITPVLVTSTPLVASWWFNYICLGLNKENIESFVTNQLHGTEEILFENQKKYSDSVKEYAIKNCVQFIDLREEFCKAQNKDLLMCKDGVHPNIEGHKFMSEIFVKELPKIELEKF